MSSSFWMGVAAWISRGQQVGIDIDVNSIHYLDPAQKAIRRSYALPSEINKVTNDFYSGAEEWAAGVRGIIEREKAGAGTELPPPPIYTTQALGANPIDVPQALPVLKSLQDRLTEKEVVALAEKQRLLDERTAAIVSKEEELARQQTALAKLGKDSAAAKNTPAQIFREANAPIDSAPEPLETPPIDQSSLQPAPAKQGSGWVLIGAGALVVAKLAHFF